jgi:galactokinase
MKEQMIKDFQKVYDYPCENVYFAPGRVNLIGEHIDYNGGYVFPCALTLGTYAAFAKRKDSKIRFYSLNFESIGILESDINSIKKENSWADYPKGVIEVLKQEGHKFPCGFDVLFYGNLPNGAGLSSSASIEILTCVFLNDSFNLNISKKETAFISQKAENSFVGVNSGIMDQFACSMGVKDRAILLNCSTFEYELVPLNLKDSSILIINTNKKRNLTDSKYNERRSECEAALKILPTK